MARQTKDKNELVKCEYCGEMYSSTYKHCPFCNEDGTGSWDEPVEEREPDTGHGGKRLMNSGSGGRKGGAPVGTIIYGIISAALIIAALGIVTSILRPLFGSGRSTQPEVLPSATVTASALPQGGDVAGVGDDQLEGDPNAETTADPVQSMTTAAPTTVTTATSFKLNREDFTLDHQGETFQMAATLTPADASAEITWKSSDANIASVSWNGVVTAVSPGTATVTASIEGLGEKSCIVRCNFKSSQGAASSGQGSSSTTTTSTSISLSREDFTLSREGESWRLVVSGAGGASVTWTSSNTSVATVGADGTVTAVGPGTCNVTATANGHSAKCIVRCSF